MIFMQIFAEHIKILDWRERFLASLRSTLNKVIRVPERSKFF